METIIERQRRQHEECERLENALTEELLLKKQTVSKKTRHMCTRQTVLLCCAYVAGVMFIFILPRLLA